MAQSTPDKRVESALAWSGLFFFFSSRRRHTRFDCDWSSDVCSSDLDYDGAAAVLLEGLGKVAPGSRPDLLLVLAESRRRQSRLPDAQRLFEEILKEIGRASGRERV